MFKVIVFTHGTLSESLKNTAELISGINEHVEYFSIPLGCDTKAVLDEVSTSILASEKSGMDVLIFTDLFFGTPFNLLFSLKSEMNFSHITGVNLPMLLEAIALQDQQDLDFNTVVADLVKKGREAINDCDVFVNNLLGKQEGCL